MTGFGHAQKRLETFWKRLHDARRSLDLARDCVSEAERDYKAGEIPSPDGHYAYLQALRAQNAALRQYSTALRTWRVVAVHDRIADGNDCFRTAASPAGVESRVTWDPQNLIIGITVSGIGNWHDGLREAIIEALASSQFKPGMSLLFDMRQVTDNPSSEDLRSCAEWLSKLLPAGISSRCAIVVGPRVHHYGLARMVAMHAEFRGMSLEIFKDIAGAQAWLCNQLT